MSELGTLLVRAREARGLTLEDAERDTRISRRYLQALESEQFEAIPAPVYARGFLRSYSQYLGLDPQQMLDMFPRDDDEPPSYQREPQRASPENPISATSASRPAWRRPQAARPAATQRRETVGQAHPRAAEPRIGNDDGYDEEDAYDRNPRPRARQMRPAEPPRRTREPEPRRQEAPREPMIGVDIGVPAPARRIKTDPAAQTRTMAVVAVAIGAIIAVIVVALLLSRAGGSAAGVDTTPRASDTQSVAGAAVITGANTATSSTTAAPGASVKVPDVINLQQAQAEQAIRDAGLKVSTLTQSATQPKGTVTDQAPAAGSDALADDTVHLVVSSGQ
jgi:cytoskeletal protein RodZ